MCICCADKNDFAYFVLDICHFEKKPKTAFNFITISPVS